MDEPDVQQLIKELAATGADPSWVAEAIALEQDAARAAVAARAPRQRPLLRLERSASRLTHILRRRDSFCIRLA
jgi:hypothetical protein